MSKIYHLILCANLLCVSSFAMDGQSTPLLDSNPFVSYYHDIERNIYFIGTCHKVDNGFIDIFRNIVGNNENQHVSLILETFNFLVLSHEPSPEQRMIFKGLHNGDFNDERLVEAANALGNEIRGLDAKFEVNKNSEELALGIDLVLAKYLATLKDYNPKFTFHFMDPPLVVYTKPQVDPFSVSINELSALETAEKVISQLALELFGKERFAIDLAREGRDLELAVLDKCIEKASHERETRWNWFGTLQKAMSERVDPRKHAIVVVVGADHISFMRRNLQPFMNSLVQHGYIQPIQKIAELGQKGIPEVWIERSIASRERGNNLCSRKEGSDFIKEAIRAYIDSYHQARVGFLLAFRLSTEPYERGKDAMVTALNNLSLLVAGFQESAPEAVLIAQLALHIKPNTRSLQRWAQAKRKLPEECYPFSIEMPWLLITSLKLALNYSEGLRVAKDLNFPPDLIKEYQLLGEGEFKQKWMQ